MSYAGSPEGVNVNLRTEPATVSNGWADDDTLTYIRNLIGSNEDDTLLGNSADNTLRGGAGNDGLGNSLLFRTLSEGAYADTDFQFNRGYLSAGRVLLKASQGDDLEIVVSRVGVETNRVIVRRYFETGDDEAYTIYRNALSDDTIVATPAETS